jgi:hypothetical protein
LAAAVQEGVDRIAHPTSGVVIGGGPLALPIAPVRAP